MHAFSRRIAIPVFFSLILVACSDRTGEGDRIDSSSSATKAAASESPAAADVPERFPRYEAVDVTDGGTIAGRIVLVGRKPKPVDFEITANADVCAGAADNNRLELGPDGGIAWGVVRLANVKRGKAPAEQGRGAFTINQLGCTYSPHVLAVPIGAQVTFRNSDPIPHNVRVETERRDVLMNVAQPGQGDADTFLVAREGPMSVGCDYHPWMNAYVFGVDNPYYAVTGPDGRFELTDVPAGTYELRMWLNGFEPKAMRDTRGTLVRYLYSAPYEEVRNVTVKAGEKVEETFRITTKN